MARSMGRGCLPLQINGSKYEGGWENGKPHGKEVENKWVHKVGTYVSDGVKHWKFLGSWHGW
jgi:hypothetical protein